MWRRRDRYRGLCACGAHAWAVLTKGFITFVSPEDAPLLAEANWHARKSNGIYASRVYATRYGESGKKIQLHRVILGEPSEIDHKDHNGLNNRRDNLRPCTPSQNIGNSRHRPGISGFRGVYQEQRTGRWVAQIADRNLGTFATPREAARAYDAAALERFGEFATLNIFLHPAAHRRRTHHLVRSTPMNRLERHNRRLLKMVGLDPAKMTKAQINRGVRALAGITRECSDPNANRRRPAAIEAWRKLVEEVCSVSKVPQLRSGPK
jgi:hypothetical protein